MKKLSIIVLVVALTLSLCACDTMTDKTVTSQINSLLEEDYSQVNITVAESFALFPDDYLESSFVITNQGDSTVVSYSYEQFRIFDKEDLTDNYKVTQTGSLTVVNGTVTQADKDEFVGKKLAEVDLPYLTETNGLSFKSVYFTDVQFDTASNKVTTFQADVKQGFEPAFTNFADFDGSNLQVMVQFDNEQIKCIKLTYDASNDAQIIITYLFSK